MLNVSLTSSRYVKRVGFHCDFVRPTQRREVNENFRTKKPRTKKYLKSVVYI